MSELISFSCRWPLLPLSTGRPAEHVEVSEGIRVAGDAPRASLAPPLANGGASEATAEDVLLVRRAKAAARMREKRRKAREAREAAAREPEADPEPPPPVARLCARCQQEPVAGPTARYCRPCRSAIFADARRRTHAQTQAGPRPDSSWPAAVLELDARLRQLEDQAETADVAELPGITTAMRTVTAQIEEGKRRAMAEAPA